MTMSKLILFLTLFFLQINITKAQDTATTNSGRTVILNTDHTWQYQEAQKNSSEAGHSLFLSISAGTAIPNEDFDTYDINSTGKAKRGLNGRIEGRYIFWKNLGGVFAFSSTINNAEYVSDTILFPSPHFGGDHSLESYTYSSGSWRTYNVLAGLCAEFGNNSVAGIVTVAGGYQLVQCPESIADASGYWYDLEFNSKYPYTASITQMKMNSGNFVLSYGAELRINVTKRIGIIGGFNILNSKASFEGESTHTYNRAGSNWPGQATPINFEKKISLFCLSAGLSYKIK
jgi:hypothetical protein